MQERTPGDESQQGLTGTPYRVEYRGYDWVLCAKEDEAVVGEGKKKITYYFQRITIGEEIPEGVPAVSLPEKYKVDLGSGPHPRLIKR